MLSIEQLRLLIEKLEKAKKVDYQELIDSNLKILKDIAMAVDANNQQVINRLDRTPEWFTMDIDQKRKKPVVSPWLFRMIQTKIYQFAKNSSIYNSLEIGPGAGMFSREFKAWKKFYFTDRTRCDDIPTNSCNFVFSWDTFVFLTQQHIKEYLKDIKRVMIPGGHAFIQYADCQTDVELTYAENTYWNYNTKSSMKEMIEQEGLETVELNQFMPGASYAIFKKPGKQKPVVEQISEIKLD